jgi:biopolymer transport protein ExbD
MKFVAADAELKSLNLPLVPMIDVFMNLLCFFLIAGHFREVERQLESDLPKLGTIGRSDELLREFWIRIKVGEGSGKTARPRIIVQDKVFTNLDDVEATIARYAQIPKAREDTVILAPDPDAHAGWVMHILGILNGLQFRNINFKR